jgi:hypothetical protein
MQIVQPNNAAPKVRWLSPTLLVIFWLVFIFYPNQIRTEETSAYRILQFPSRQENQSSSLGQTAPSGITAEARPSDLYYELDVFSAGSLFPVMEQPIFFQENSCKIEQVAVHVFIPGHFSLPIIQQPTQKPLYVSTRTGEITQFKRAAAFGAIGLLAHNYLSGKEFYQLESHDPVWVLYNNGQIQRYQICATHRYRKLDQDSPTSDFIDLENGEILSSTQVFNRFYRSKDQLIFQTCLENEGDSNWGLYFVEAEPVVN